MKSHNSNAREILGNNIVYFRLKNQWSQEEFADKLGSTSRYVSNLENAKKNTRIDYIDLIASTLNVEVDQLFIKRDKVLKKRVSKY